MKSMNLAIFATCATVAMVAAAPAHAADFTYTYSGTAGSGISGSGTISTGASNPAGSFFTPSLLVTAITGTFNGNAITGLLPAGTFYKTSGIFGSPGNDNILYYPSSQTYMGQTTYLDRYGIAFSTGAERINLFFGLGGYGSISQLTGASGVTSDVGGRFTISPAAVGSVPEPAAWAMMIVGMGAIGFAMRRRTSVATRVNFG